MCGHPDPELCGRLGMHIHGRLWEIWNGINITAEKAAVFRAMWEAQACPHKGKATGDKVRCKTCGATDGSVDLFFCDLHTRCSQDVLLTGIACCRICPDRPRAG